MHVQIEARTVSQATRPGNGLVVSDAAAAAGSVSIEEPTLLTVRSNDPAGYLLRFDLDPERVSSVEVEGLGVPTTLHSPGGWISQPAALGTQSFTLRYRVHLRPGVSPGTYAFPVAVTAENRNLP